MVRTTVKNFVVQALTRFMPKINARVASLRLRAIAKASRISRVDRHSRWFRRPFAADRALPAIVLGPVDFAHGRALCAAARKRSRPASVIGPRSFWFLRPAATRRGFGPLTVDAD